MKKDEILKEILAYMEEHMGKSARPEDSFLEDLALSSLEFMDLAGAMEELYDLELDTASLRSIISPLELSEYLLRLMGTEGGYEIRIGERRTTYSGSLRAFILAHASEIEKEDTLTFIHQIEKWEEAAEPGEEMEAGNLLIRKM